MSVRTEQISFENLLAHAGFLRAVAIGLLGDEHAADDVVQDAWLTALERPPRHQSNVRGWLGAVVRNLSLKRLRAESCARRRIADIADAAVLRPPISAADAVVARLETQRRIVDSVLSLKEPYRSAIVDRFLDGCSPSEMARRDGIPVKTVETRLRRALKLLRDRFAREYAMDRREWEASLLPIVGIREGSPVLAGGATAASFVACLLGMSKMKLSAVLALGWAVGASVALSVGARPPLDEGPLSPVADPVRVQSATGPTSLEPWGALPRRRAAAKPAEVPDAGPARAGRGGGDEQRITVGRPRRSGPSVPETKPLLAPSVASPRRADVRGRVLDTLGRPVAGAWVGVVDPEPLTLFAALLPFSRAIETTLTITAPDGTFKLPEVPLGVQRLCAGRDGYEVAVSEFMEFDAEAGPRRVRLNLERLAIEPWIVGCVLGPDGAPAPGALVQYVYDHAGGRESGRLWTDGQGCFEIAIPESAVCRIVAGDLNARIWALAEDVGPGRVELRLEPR